RRVRRGDARVGRRDCGSDRATRHDRRGGARGPRRLVSLVCTPRARHTLHFAPTSRTGRLAVRSTIAAVLALLCAAGVHAADQVKVGFVSTLSGPGAAIGTDIRDGFNLATKTTGGKLGGLPAEISIGDDQQNPDVGRQIVDKYLKRDHVDFVTGIVFSNVL